VAGAVVQPLVQAAAARVHEEVTDGGQLQAQLLGDGHLQLLGGTLVLLEDGVERPSLHVGEHQPGLLGHAVAVIASVVHLLPLARCRQQERERERQREREKERERERERERQRPQ